VCQAQTIQEPWRQLSYLVWSLVHREMTGVEQVDFGTRDVALVGCSTRLFERGVVAAPHDDARRLAFAQPRLPKRVGGHVGAIVVEQVALDL
jgi:hypothetical protein